MATCRLCERECDASSDLCRYHLIARRNVESAYSQWNEAYGGMTWKDYLQRIRDDAQTGLWAKEVAELLLSEEAAKV